MAEPIHIGAAADIPEGEAVVVPAATAGTSDDVAVFHAEDGAFYAIDDTCTHANVSLAEGEIEGDRIECWLHGSRFDLRTGECLDAVGKEPMPLTVWSVEVRDGVVFVARPEVTT